MSQYRLDISGNFSLSDYSNINDYIELVDSDDAVTVNFNNVSSENVNIVCNMLQEKNFSILSKGEDGEDTISLSAVRKSNCLN